VVRAHVEPVAITDRDIRLERPSWVQRGGRRARRRRIYARQFDALVHPETMPAFGRIAAEESGDVWVQRYEPDAQELPEWWARFDRSGRLLGTLAIPEGFSVIGFSRGHVILREPIGEFGFVGLSVYAFEQAHDPRPAGPESP
jgi:hypothetical protein